MPERAQAKLKERGRKHNPVTWLSGGLRGTESVWGGNRHVNAWKGRGLLPVPEDPDREATRRARFEPSGRDRCGAVWRRDLQEPGAQLEGERVE